MDFDHNRAGISVLARKWLCISGTHAKRVLLHLWSDRNGSPICEASETRSSLEDWSSAAGK